MTYGYIPRAARDALERQTQLLLSKEAEQEQRLEEPPDGSRVWALVRDAAPRDEAGPDVDLCSGVVYLYDCAIGATLEQPEEGDLVLAYPGILRV